MISGVKHLLYHMECLSFCAAVLESWLDHSGELEPPDPLSRLPQLKQRIRWLLHDLCTVRRLSCWRWYVWLLTGRVASVLVGPLPAPPGGTGQHEGFYKLKVDLLHFTEVPEHLWDPLLQGSVWRPITLRWRVWLDYWLVVCDELLSHTVVFVHLF